MTGDVPPDASQTEARLVATFKLAHYPKFTYATRRPGLRGALPITDPELSWPVPHCVLNRRARIPAARVAAERLLRRLADARLLVIAVENGIARIEVAHEAIFRVWHLLAGWLQEEREFLIGKSRIEKARDDHTQLADIERARGLLSGILLDRAKAWLTAHPGRFSPDEVAFINASAEEAERVEKERASERDRLREAELARAISQKYESRVIGIVADAIRVPRTLSGAADSLAMALNKPPSLPNVVEYVELLYKGLGELRERRRIQTPGDFGKHVFALSFAPTSILRHR